MSSNTLPNKQVITSYGQVVAFTDAVPIVDASTEWSSSGINPLRNDVAGLTQTAVLCHFQILGVADGYTPVVTGSATWSSGIDQCYTGNVPTFAPVVVGGQMTCTLPAFVADSFGNSIPLNIHGVEGRVCSGTTHSNIICQVVSSNSFTVLLSAGNLTGSLIQFWVY